MSRQNHLDKSTPSASASNLGVVLSVALSAGGLIGLMLWSTHQPAPPPRTVSSALVNTQRVNEASAPSLAPLAVSSETPTPPEKLDPTAVEGLGARVQTLTQTSKRKARELPSELSLGERLISLRGGEARLRISVSLSSDSPEVIQRAIPLRGRLTSMLYFLISHRVPEAMRTPSGEERLRRDLHQRFKNLLRRDDFKVHFDGLTLEELADDDAYDGVDDNDNDNDNGREE